ncbi:helix-turn-helix transcriptional regulator [Ralstonia sp. SET104]|uniref:ArsR/SmtB family transcription factor n=1 Tax=Ralstonia sp. SET104 TaxID=2448774 RepID=UPI000FFA4405|nr:metalloregulator ArsR/SmtB family transcription factor [Ralstonia sp. SET104]GCB02489.1 transcriptional regulator [Ralstonia sp. SET104]
MHYFVRCAAEDVAQKIERAAAVETLLRRSVSERIVSQMDNNVIALDAVFHALADPTRRAVIQRLGQGPATVSELAEPFDMALPSFMKHMRVLEGVGLVRSEKSGRIRTCTLERKKLAAAERWFEKQHAIWASRYRNLDNLLEKLQGEDDEA